MQDKSHGKEDTEGAMIRNMEFSAITFSWAGTEIKCTQGEKLELKPKPTPCSHPSIAYVFLF